MRAAIVIPALDEHGTIAAVVAALRPYGDAIVVDDGSSDDTALAARGAGATVISHDRNRGYDAALATGFAHAAQAGYEAIATIDGDAQHDPAVLERLLAPILAGEVELVVGVRRAAARPSERLFNAYTRLRYGVPDILCGMKAYAMPLYRRHADVVGRDTIGTGLAVAALREGVTHRTVDVPIRARDGASRFGTSLHSELRILRAMALAMRGD